MKKITSLLTGCAITLLTASCEKELPVFSTNDCWLNFAYYDYYNELITSNEEITDEMRTTYYSFITSSAAAGKELQTDTIWLEVTTMGFLSDKDQQIELVQLQTDGRNAIPGQHYEAFDTPSLLEKSVVRAGTNSAFIPIVVKRDVSLTQGDVALKLTFKDNGIFKPGYAGMAERTIYISDKLARPNNWEDYYFGTYGPVKHELMIKWTNNSWDEDYLNTLYQGDSGYIDYLAHWLSEKLAEENAIRIANGEDVYKEADGTEVAFIY